MSLQDCDWLVAHILLPLPRTVGASLVPHIWHVLRNDDAMWKYWLIACLIPSLPPEGAVEFRAESE